MSPVLQSSIALLARVGSILCFGNLQAIFHLHMFVQMQEIGWQKKIHSKKGNFWQKNISNAKTKTKIDCYCLCCYVAGYQNYDKNIAYISQHNMYAIKYNNPKIFNRQAF